MYRVDGQVSTASCLFPLVYSLLSTSDNRSSALVRRSKSLHRSRSDAVTLLVVPGASFGVGSAEAASPVLRDRIERCQRVPRALASRLKTHTPWRGMVLPRCLNNPYLSCTTLVSTSLQMDLKRRVWYESCIDEQVTVGAGCIRCARRVYAWQQEDAGNEFPVVILNFTE